MKGADQCPKCASRKHGDVSQDVTGFYAVTIRVCANCGTPWEPFDPADLLDVDEQLSSFIEPCNNCAFRPGSPEQQDKKRWAELMAELDAGGSFYCHKGVPMTPGVGNGFAYPEDGKNRKKLRLCRGYLKTLRAKMDKQGDE